MQVYFCLLKERYLSEHAMAAWEQICWRGRERGYQLWPAPYQRTDHSRNIISRAFAERAESPDDVLVMLDADHAHPPDVVERLVAHQKPVVGALAFRRGPPYFPCVFFRDAQGELKIPKRLEPKALHRVAAVGTGAIAIQRRVFDELQAKDHPWPWFCYTYPPGDIHPSEDMFFCRQCEVCDIPMYCDFTLVTPHLTTGYVEEPSWLQWLADNPDGGTYASLLMEGPRELPPAELRLPDLKTVLHL